VKTSALAGDFSGAVSSAAMACARTRQTDAVVHVAAADGVASFACSGLGIAIKAMVEANVDEPGADVVSADRLGGLLAGFSSKSTITLSSATNALTVTGGAARYRLPIFPDAPAALEIDSEIARGKMPAGDLLSLLGVSPAADTEQSRLYLCAFGCTASATGSSASPRMAPSCFATASWLARFWRIPIAA
jgi:DNA polymerase III subunit beta